MRTLKEAALALAALRALQKVLSQAVEDTTTEVEAGMRDLGSRTMDVWIGDEQHAATISTKTGKVHPYVADENAFIAYVAANYPDEIIRSVRSSFRKAILDSLDLTEAGYVKPFTGEVVPGVAAKPGTLSLAVRQSPEDVAALAAAWQAGEIDLATMVEGLAPEPLPGPDPAR